MHVDVALMFGCKAPYIFKNVLNTIPDDWEVKFDEESERICVRNDFSYSEDINEAVVSFLNSLRNFEPIMDRHYRLMRVGLFYDIRETMVFIFTLNPEATSLIHEFNVYLKILVYAFDGKANDD